MIERAERHGRLIDWTHRPIAERMSFSSMSRAVSDIWGRDIPRPFSIRLEPGYTIPEGLDLTDMDAIFPVVALPLNEQLVAWDGFSAAVLFEIIDECFDPAGSSEYIHVYDNQTGERVDDPRDPAIRQVRPSRETGWGRNAVWNHFFDLVVWSGMFRDRECRQLNKLYSVMVTQRTGSDTSTKDANKRASWMSKRDLDNDELYDVAAKIVVADERSGYTHPIHRGTARPADSPEERRDMLIEIRKSIQLSQCFSGKVSLEDLPDGRPPASYFDLKRAKHFGAKRTTMSEEDMEPLLRSLK